MSTTRVYVGASCLAGVLMMSAAPAAGATDMSTSKGTLRITDRASERNSIDVETLGLFAYAVNDDLARVTAGPGCTAVSAHRAVCGPALTIVAALGAGDDWLGLLGVPAPVTADGGPGDDGIASGASADDISGGVGIDSLYGGGGNDRLSGGSGNDVLDGEDGSDTILAGAGDDIASAGPGDADVVLGESGDDLVSAGDGNDRVDGGAGNDALVAGSGDDTLATGPGADKVFGAHPGDAIDCRPGDLVAGGAAGCDPLARTEQPPATWPAASRSLLQSRLIEASATAEIPHHARYAKVTVTQAPPQVHTRVDVQVKGKTGSGHTYATCVRMKTNSVKARSMPKSAWPITKLTARVPPNQHCK